MNLLHIVPGSGGTFYCQNCLRDIALVRALRSRGHEVTLLPMYLPISVEEKGVAGETPVFFGGINVYLQQKFPLFRKTPYWMDRFFDSRWMLRHAAAREGTTEAAGLGPMTLSMLQGVDGNQEKELHRLTTWIKEQPKPDVIHLSNSLLLGLAGELKRRLDIPIVCALQDEEGWLDDIHEPYRTQCWETMGTCSESADGLVSVSDWYADEMAQRMGIARDRITTVPLGINLEGFAPAAKRPNPPVLGYLSKLTPSLGLGQLVDAYITLKKNPRLANLRLIATGGAVGGDVAFVEDLQAKLDAHGCIDDVKFLEDFDRPNRIDFLQSLSVLSVPVPEGEAFGMFILEALACGVPVVQPDVGAFREVVESTGGGIIYDPGDPEALAESLEKLLLDKEKARELGAQGRKVTNERYSIGTMAENLEAVYASVQGK